MAIEKCHVCGSKAIIPNVTIVDRGHHSLPGFNLAVQILRNPKAKLFKAGEMQELKAWVCGECGHVEIFVNNPDVLYDAWLEHQKNL